MSKDRLINTSIKLLDEDKDKIEETDPSREILDEVKSKEQVLTPDQLKIA